MKKNYLITLGLLTILFFENSRLYAGEFSVKDIPIQESGRIKPLDTYARNQALTFYGKRKIKHEELSAIDWLLDLFIYPDKGLGQKVFNIRNPEVLDVLDGDFYPDNYLGVLQKTLISLFYYTGIRRIELIELKCSHVDIEQGMMKVLGKRNKERLVPLLSQMCTQLLLLLKHQEDEQIPREAGLFFVSTGPCDYNRRKTYKSLKC